MNKVLTCIVCPKGCKITVSGDENNIDSLSVCGNSCPRGVEYGIKEVTAPTRVVTSTVKVESDLLRQLPVKTDIPIDKNKIFDCMREIKCIKVKAPVKVGQVLLQNVLNTGVNIVATRSLNK